MEIQFTHGTPEAQRLFAAIGSELMIFAKTRNLFVEKYWHAHPSWRFSFKHPKGDVATVEIFGEDGADSVRVFSYWWLDDYDSGVRNSVHYSSDV